MGTNLMNGNHLHVRCMDYIMNLVVHDGLEESSLSIERVRWNSTYLMLSRAVEFENAFSHYASHEIGLRHYLEHSYIEDGVPTGELLSSDWKNQLIESEDIVLSEMAIKMKENFDKYWSVLGKMNKIIFISCILDPRYKLESVGYALLKMFGENPGATIQAKVKKCITSLFNEYLKSSSKGVALASSSSFSSLDTSTSGLSGSQKYKTVSGGVDARTELDKYFGEETEDDTKEFDVLRRWKMNSARFPILVDLARDVLAVPVSSVASECAFST
ncbi:zinc finger BED domain-containing protein RICESLEEPER 1-like [Nicotiana tabacum]|uniref:Zinc finger BED domain-containing protein RICESLEEPER 1-like n=1 Tax=Nicotiana tabacum TaxID=4097 RepID=A0AC58T3L1_TOBAC